MSAKITYGVYCKVHGVMNSKVGWPVVRVPVPKSRSATKTSGCPKCRALQKAN